jgi:succinate dehydrogenase / fumarate reductase, cytochrome b subunit
VQAFLRKNHFLLRRLHSLSGIVPVVGFMLMHFYENAKALQSPEAYNEAVKMINSLPAVLFLEIFFIFLPLYFHAIYGIYITMDSRNNVKEYGYGRNWAFFWQRVTGLFTLFFVTFHLWQFRFQKALGAYDTGTSMPGQLDYHVVAKALSSNFMMAFYVLGVVAASYHLCNGVYTFLITWGITVGPKSQRISNIVTNLAFVAVSALGIAAAIGFRI